MSRNKEFENIFNEWETIRLRRFDKQDIPITAFETIWEQGAEALMAAKNNQIWQIDIFQSAGGPMDGTWVAFDAHPMKIYSKDTMLALHPNRKGDLPLLHKTKGISSYYKRMHGENGETLRWRDMLLWYFNYMRALDMTAIDPDNWSRGTSVYGACTNLRKSMNVFW